MNLIVESYLCDPNTLITDLAKLKANPDNFLININNIGVLERIKNEIDQDYINGVIYIQYNDQIIFDYTMWDLVDQLWSYMVTVIEEYRTHRIGLTYFPDQPIQFGMEKGTNDKLIFRLHTYSRHEWLLPEKEFLYVLLQKAIHFFSRLKELSLIDDMRYKYEINRINKLVCNDTRL